MLTNRWLPGISSPRPRFQIFGRGKQWSSDERQSVDRPTAAYVPSNRRKPNRSTSFPVNDVTTAQGIIWVDAVGGFLSFTGDTIRIGQALPDNQIEVPIVGDISRQHAVIQRSGEDYLLTPHGRTRVAGKIVGGLTRLTDGDEIELNDTVQLRFRKPHPLSNSARLDVLSHHRTSPPVDGILLIGQNLILGQDQNSHIVCRDWNHSLVLQSQATEPTSTKESVFGSDKPSPYGGFRFQSAEPVQAGGNAANHTGCIEWGERLTGENFALVLERL